MSKIKQAAQTAVKVIIHAGKTANVFAPESVVIHRLETCKTCEKFLNDHCQVCGCKMSSKTQLTAATCPLKRWKE